MIQLKWVRNLISEMNKNPINIPGEPSKDSKISVNEIKKEADELAKEKKNPKLKKQFNDLLARQLRRIYGR